METSYAELKCKQIINVVDGKCLGRLIDIVLDVKTCKILGLVVPNPSCGSWSFFRKNREVFIPFHSICKIGVDVILVELYVERHDDCCDPCDNKKQPIKDRDKHNDKCKTFTLKDEDYKVK